MYENLALSDSGFLFDGKSGFTYSLNRTGTFLLKRLIQGARPDQLSALLASEFEVDAATAERDVSHFLQRLRDHRVIEAANDEDSWDR